MLVTGWGTLLCDTPRTQQYVAFCVYIHLSYLFPSWLSLPVLCLLFLPSFPYFLSHSFLFLLLFSSLSFVVYLSCNCIFIFFLYVAALEVFLSVSSFFLLFLALLSPYSFTGIRCCYLSCCRYIYLYSIASHEISSLFFHICLLLSVLSPPPSTLPFSPSPVIRCRYLASCHFPSFSSLLISRSSVNVFSQGLGALSAARQLSLTCAAPPSPVPPALRQMQVLLRLLPLSFLYSFSPSSLF